MIVKNHKKSFPDFFFIQIGSNDGVTGDPISKYIKKYYWKGIFVEPVRYLFKKLKKNYDSHKNVFFENVAISNKTGLRNFYRIKKNNELNNPVWYDQLGSFNKEVVLKHKNLIPNFDKHFIQEKVKCVTFLNLLNKHKIKSVDFLHIDTEGYDFEIIKLIPFKILKPQMILFEYVHLSKKDQKKSLELLKKEKYKFLYLNQDIFAYL
ncbi:MAG: FkbM family methyltransferase [Candidatus Nanoarchaeia archaeon]|nr:FkbM family methyltransferase [Candidatus Nanoarchaeia archaeon]